MPFEGMTSVFHLRKKRELGERREEVEVQIIKKKKKRRRKKMMRENSKAQMTARGVKLKS